MQFNFADPQSISGNGTVTLLRPSQSHPHRNGSPLDHTPLGSPDSECVCGPVRVKQFLDITNHSVRINFCHPDLLRGQVTTLWLLVEDLFSDDWKYGGRPSSAAAAARPASPSSSPGSRLISALRQRNKAAQTKSFSSTEQGILLVSLYPPKESSPMASQLGLFIQLMESQQFLSHLVLVACSHRVQRAEYEKLPRPLQGRVDSIEEKDPLLSKENQLRALELLCWAASLHSWKYVCQAVCASKFSMCPPNAVRVTGLHVRVTGLHVHVTGMHVCVTELLVQMTKVYVTPSIGAYCSDMT